MINRLILFLVRRKLHLRKNQRFRFKNQKSSTDCYYFGDTHIFKTQMIGFVGFDNFIPSIILSNVSLNYLISDECEVVVCE